MINQLYTAWKLSIFGVFLVRVQSEFKKTQTRKTPNAETFYALLLPITDFCVDDVLSYMSQSIQECRPYPFKFFKDCLPQILFGPFLNA